MRRLPLLLLLVFAFPTAHAGAVTCARRSVSGSSRQAPRLERVVVIVMENEGCSAVIGSRDAPYLNRLARRSAFAARSFALTSPSLPNYLALTGGSTFGIRTDCTSCRVRATNLVDQLERAHCRGRPTWRGCRRGATAAPRPGST